VWLVGWLVVRREREIGEVDAKRVDDEQDQIEFCACNKHCLFSAADISDMAFLISPRVLQEEKDGADFMRSNESVIPFPDEIEEDNRQPAYVVPYVITFQRKHHHRTISSTHCPIK
jgi:hypothetical protein